MLSAVNYEQGGLTYQYPPHNLTYSAVSLGRLSTPSSFPSPSSRHRASSRQRSDASTTLPDVRLRIPESNHDEADHYRRTSPRVATYPTSSGPAHQHHRAGPTTYDDDVDQRPVIPSIFGNDRTVPQHDGAGSVSPYEFSSPSTQGHSPMSDGYQAPPSRDYASNPYLSYHPAIGHHNLPAHGGTNGSYVTNGLGGEHSNEQRIKRRRGNLPKSVTDLLKSWFRAHRNHPYPSEDEKQMLMCQTGLTITQVRHHVFFVTDQGRGFLYCQPGS